jgi:hypothetical protein
MGHRRPYGRHAAVIECHPDLAMEDLQQRAVPVLDDVVMRGKTLVDKVAQVLTDRLASVPVGNAEIAHGVVRETVEALAEGLVINFLPHRQQPFRRFGFGEGDRRHFDPPRLQRIDHRVRLPAARMFAPTRPAFPLSPGRCTLLTAGRISLSAQR